MVGDIFVEGILIGSLMRIKNRRIKIVDRNDNFRKKGWKIRIVIIEEIERKRIDMIRKE